MWIFFVLNKTYREIVETQKFAKTNPYEIFQITLFAEPNAGKNF